MDITWAQYFKINYPGINAGQPGGMEKMYQQMIANGDGGNAAYLIKPQMLEPRLNMFIARNNEWVIWNNKGYFKASLPAEPPISAGTFTRAKTIMPNSIRQINYTIRITGLILSMH